MELGGKQDESSWGLAPFRKDLRGSVASGMIEALGAPSSKSAMLLGQCLHLTEVMVYLF